MHCSGSKLKNSQIKISKAVLLFLSAFILISQISASTDDEMRREALDRYYRKDFLTAERLLSRYSSAKPADSEIGVAYAETLAVLIRADSLKMRAVAAVRLNRFNEAEVSLQLAERFSPNDQKLVELWDYLEEARESNKPFEHLSKEEKKQFDDYLSSAKKAWQSGNTQLALDYYSRCLSIAPKSPEAVEGYAEARKVRGKFITARNIETLLKEAELLRNANRLPQAISRYEEVLRQDPGNETAQQQVKELNSNLQKQQESSARLELAGDYKRNGELALLQKNFDEALAQFNLGKAVNPSFTDWTSMINKVNALREAGVQEKFEENLAILESKFQKGIVAMAREEYQSAIADFEAVIQIAEKYEQSDTRKQASELVKVARENLQLKEEETVNPESPYFQLVGTLHALGQEALQRKNYAEAKKHYTSILELFPRNKLANAYLISANISQKPESRAEVLEKLYQQAEQEKNKNPIEAKRLLDLIASISPTDSRIQKIREDIQKQSPVRRDPQVSDEKLNLQYENAISIAQQNPAGAIQICKSILNSNPGFAKARSLQARIESRLNESKWRQPAKELNPQAERFYADGVIAYNSGRIRDARNLFQRAVQLQPDFVRAKNALQKCSAYLNS